MSKPDGGPAFAKTGNYVEEQKTTFDSENQNGMSLRAYSAAKALQGMLAKTAYEDDSCPDMRRVRVEIAVAYADALLAELAKD